MRIGTPVEDMAAALYSSLADSNILPDIDITYGRGTEKQKGRPRLDDIEVYQFPQTWGSTALGFEGMGGAAMTKAYTTVIVCGENAAVFFGGRHCYSIDNISAEFWDDLNKKWMPSIKDARERYK